MTKSTHFPRNRTVWFALAVLFTPIVVAADLTVGGYTLQSVTKVSGLYHYAYTAKVTNSGATDAQGVNADLTPESAALIQAVDGHLDFGNVATGSSAVSSDTFTLSGTSQKAPSGRTLSSGLKWVVHSNASPVANPGADQTVNLGDTVFLDASRSTDRDGDPLSYHWVLVTKPADSFASLRPSPLAVGPSFLIDQPGEYVAKLVVNDGQTDSQADTVRIGTQNSRPVADAGPDQTIPMRSTAILDGQGSRDIDGDALTYAWTLTVKPKDSKAILSNPASPTPSFKLDKAGRYEARLVVNDGHDSSKPAVVTISTQNSKPVANAGEDQTIDQAVPVTLAGTGTDVDGNPLTYRWALIHRPAGSQAALTAPSAPSVQITPDLNGDYVAQLIVNDSQADSNPDTVRVTVATPVQPVQPVTEDGLLNGFATQAALEVIQDYDNGDLVPDSEFAASTTHGTIVRTKLVISLRPDVYVGEVNNLLQPLGAHITSLLEGVSLLVVRIPDPGSVEALEAVKAALEQSPLVEFVNFAHKAQTDQVPTAYETNLPTNINYIDHHLAIGAHAAWNAMNALNDIGTDAPRLIVQDYFGDGVPNVENDVHVVDAIDFATGNKDSHGYHVLGIIAGTFNSSAGVDASVPQGLVTGIYPDLLNQPNFDLRVVDLKYGIDTTTANERMIKKIARAQGNVVVNTSVGPICPVPVQRECMEPKMREWAKMVRDYAMVGTLERKFLHLTAAGNKEAEGDDDAKLDSDFAGAHLLTDLRDSYGDLVQPLSNTLVIENRLNTNPATATITDRRVQAGCLKSSSKVGGDLSAIGTDVFSFLDQSGATGNLDGTSQATPQVAGLAAYVWTLKPSLTPQQVADILTRTAVSAAELPPDTSDPRCNKTATPAPVVDAYAAVLAVDDAAVIDGSGADPKQAPARLAILDIAAAADTLGEDGRFDEKDLKLWTSFVGADAPGNLDYSRFDLNGDGRTGGTSTAKFNLDINYPPTYTTVKRTIEGVEKSFNEKAATDMDLLCYYAYSPLYQEAGDQPERRTLLNGKCGHVEQIAFVSDRDGNYEIYVMNADGSAQENRSKSSAADYNPTWSPDGSRIVFMSNQGGGDLEIYVVNADGSGTPTNLSKSAVTTDDNPTWSPDGSRIAFRSKPVYCGSYDVCNTEIRVVNANGSEDPTTLIRGTTQKYGALSGFYLPTWSPDGSQIAFRSYRFVNDGAVSKQVDEIYVVNADAYGIGTATRLSESGSEPIWSPDGSQIGFTSYRDGNWEVYVMNADGSAPENRSTSAGEDYFATWSPDGSRIAFLSFRDGNGEIYVVNANGSGGLMNLSKSSALDQSPIWSPDGSRIAFLSDRDGNGEIYVVNTNGSGGLMNLSKSSGFDSTPTWSPDGGRIAFESTRDGDNEIYVANANGSGTPTNLSKSSGSVDSGPAWSP